MLTLTQNLVYGKKLKNFKIKFFDILYKTNLKNENYRVELLKTVFDKKTDFKCKSIEN